MSLSESCPTLSAAPGTEQPSQFQREIEERADRTRTWIDQATADGEEYLAEVHLAELESLVRLAHDHDVELPAASDYLQRNAPVVDLTALEGRQVDLTALEGRQRTS